ncbi:MAG TPA: hypothetical protein VK504_03685 [Vicinamibacterales bacterium]|jgi:hypothetical protein|nr:hypothetical protein [Vicinamibacterales bacterium]
MTVRHLVVVGLSGLLCVTLNPRVHATQDHDKHDDAPVGLLKAVREATEQFRDVRAAIAANYASLGSCVSGPERGAMGIHYGNGALIMDGVIDAKTPELLIYEQRGGKLRFVGVEFLVLADAWNASHPDGTPPVLMGQHFQFVGTPNRYRLPAFYELHVWAWRDNPFGTFVDWNPDVSCAEFNPGGAMH